MGKFGSDNLGGRLRTEADYSLQISARVLRSIQTEYEKFETLENKRRKKALREIFDEFRREGRRIVAFFGGSLETGQSLESSDIDVRLLANEGGGQKQTKQLLSERIHQKLGKEVKVDFYFWGQFVDLLQVKRALDEINATGTTKKLAGVLDLYFAFQVFHLRMGVDCHRLISKVESLRYKSIVLNNGLNALNKNRLPEKRRFLAGSFGKYRERLRENPNFPNLSEEEQRKIYKRLDTLEHQFINL